MLCIRVIGAGASDVFAYTAGDSTAAVREVSNKLQRLGFKAPHDMDELTRQCVAMRWSLNMSYDGEAHEFAATI